MARVRGAYVPMYQTFIKFAEKRMFNYHGYCSFYDELSMNNAALLLLTFQ